MSNAIKSENRRLRCGTRNVQGVHVFAPTMPTVAQQRGTIAMQDSNKRRRDSAHDRRAAQQQRDKARTCTAFCAQAEAAEAVFP